MNSVSEKKASNQGQLIVVGGAKGGVGKTTLAVNLAVALAKKALKVCIIDADFQFGDVNLAMDIQETFTIKDVVEGIDTIDANTIDSFLIEHESGVAVLPAPDRPEYADIITDESLQKITAILTEIYDYVIVDTGVGFHENSLHFLEKASRVLLITNLEMATIKNSKRMIETLKMLGFSEKVEIVINRSTMDSVLNAENVIEVLAADNPYLVPNDFKSVSLSFNMGTPLVLGKASNPVSKAIFKMAEQMSSNTAPQRVKQKKRFFGLG
jgi:pilus assembly protein CpaE